MNKKLIVVLIASLFLFTLVNAESCNPDSGYNRCFYSEDSNSYKKCTATVNAKVQAHTVQTEGREIRQYVTGPTYIKYDIDAKYGGIIFESDFDDIWDRFDCSKHGCDTNFDKETKKGKYYLTKNTGDKWESGPLRIVAYDHELFMKPSCWVWTAEGRGWGYPYLHTRKQVECYGDKDCSSNQYCDKSGDWRDWSCEQKECNSGDTDCRGEGNNIYYNCDTSDYSWQKQGIVEGECDVECTNLGKTRCKDYTQQECSDYQWKDIGITIGECGVECKSDIDCGDDSYTSDNYCEDGNVVKDFKTYSCSNYKCESSETQEIQQECDFGCGEGMCLPEPQEPQSPGISDFLQSISDWINSLF